jgi:putative transcriptional regulator
MKFRIRELRGERHMSQGALAEACGVTQAMISSVERGRYRPGLETLELVARALDVQVPDLFVVEGEDADLYVLVAAARRLSRNDRRLLLELARRLLGSQT